MDGSVIPADAAGCHGGRETMLEASRAAGKSEALDRLLKDYPEAHTISRNRCARLSVRCESGCECAVPRRSFPGLLVVYTG